MAIPDVAMRFLLDHPVKTGPIAPSPSTIRRAIRRVRGVLGWWQADCLRHSAASYHLALTGDAGKVATMLGNSPKILLTHYNGLASKEDAARFFDIQ